MSDYKSKYFTRQELACPCCGVLFLADGFLIALDGLREEVAAPFVITSGYRCLKHNSALKDSSPNSQHLKGNAVDVQCTPALAYKIMRVAHKYGFYGIGIKKGMIHLDRRSQPLSALFGY